MTAANQALKQYYATTQADRQGEINHHLMTRKIDLKNGGGTGPTSQLRAKNPNARGVPLKSAADTPGSKKQPSNASDDSPSSGDNNPEEGNLNFSALAN